LAKAIDCANPSKTVCTKLDKKSPSNGGFKGETPMLRCLRFDGFQDGAKIRGLEA
jgi:hypothetical protein